MQQKIPMMRLCEFLIARGYHKLFSGFHLGNPGKPGKVGEFHFSQGKPASLEFHGSKEVVALIFLRSLDVAEARIFMKLAREASLYKS